VVAVYLLNNNYCDDAGNFANLIQAGSSGGEFTTDHKYDSYSWRNDLNNNYRIFPISLESAIGQATKFTIQFWTEVPIQQPSTPLADTYMTRGPADNWPPESGNFLVLYSTSSTWYPNSVALWFNTNNTSNLQQLSAGYTTGWHLMSVEWDGNNEYFYKDGTEYITLASSTNPFSVTSFNGTFYLGTIFGQSDGDYNIQSGIQRVMFSNKLYNGAEILPSTPTATSTATITYTITKTFTITPTYTRTATFT
jgi:hypothetical protein